MKVVAVIPCRNEGTTIGEVVAKTLRHVDEVLVIDNRSTDWTAVIAEEAGAHVYVCTELGAGASTRLGMSYALNPKREADVIITLDGDGQHDPDDIPILLKGSWEADVVIGSRFLNGGYRVPAYRKFGIDIITWLYNVGYRNKLTDGQSCFRVFSKGVAKWLLERGDLVEDGFAFSTEWLVKARRAGYLMTEVPIRCIYHREYAANSSTHPFAHGFSVALKTVKWRLWEKWDRG